MVLALLMAIWAANLAMANEEYDKDAIFELEEITVLGSRIAGRSAEDLAVP